MDYGTLRVATPAGEVREHVLDSPSIYVGRAETNRVVIDHVSVSRRHARLTIESGRLMVEDLDSSSGTYVGGNRLASNRAFVVEEGQPIRFGDVDATFVPAGAMRSAAPAAGAAPSGPIPVAAAAGGLARSTQQFVGVTLRSPSEPVAAGATTTATAVVQNRGTTVDELEISVGGSPAAWARVSRAQVSLLPGARDEVVVNIEPPRTTAVQAGEYEFTVIVKSRQHGSEVRAVGTLVVLPFGGMEAQLEPVRAERNFRLVIANEGNAPLAGRLAASDDEEAIEFKLASPQVEVPPGESRTVPLQASLRSRKLFGPQAVHPFRVEITPDGDGPQVPKAVVNGQLVRKPPLEAWKRPVLAVLLLVALLGGGVGYTRQCGSSWPFCPRDSSILASSGGVDGASLPGGASPSPSSSASGSVAGSPAASPSAGASPSSGAGSPTAGASASPVPSATTPTGAPPKIQWIIADHAGSGAVSVRVSTDVPTTAVLSVYRAPLVGRATPVPTPAPVTSAKPTTLHSLSIGTFGLPAGFAIEVKDADGRGAFGSLEYDGSVSGYWAPAGKVPTLEVAAGFKATATWVLAADPAAKPSIDVLLFSKKAGCTTADGCVGDLVRTFPAASKAASDNIDFSASIAFPDNKHDYQVLLVSRRQFTSGDRKGADNTQFYEISLAGSRLK